MDEKIVKGRITHDGKIATLESLPSTLHGEIYVAFIPDQSKKFHFGKGKMKWNEDHSIIELYKEQRKKERARKDLKALLNKGFDIRGKAYSSRNDIYETRTRSF